MFAKTLIPRRRYQDILERSRDLPVIKVITGMRRCGKSYLMDLHKKYLLDSGVPPSRIYHRKFDIETEEDVPDHRDLIDDARSKLELGPGTYILLDEIQDVDGWERAVETFFGMGADVYITGSNSRMLSTELSTKISGRYIEVDVKPLSFTEYRDFRKTAGDMSPDKELLRKYIRNGSLPTVALLDQDDSELLELIITGIFNTVYVRDVLNRNNIRNEPMMGNLNRYLCRNIGDRTSVRSAAKYMTSSGMKTSPETIENYINMLADSRLFYRARRIDSKTKDYLVTFDKYYCNDVGIRNTLVGLRPDDYDGILENLVYMELLFRYGKTDVCDVDGKTVDFVVWKNDYKGYFQVAYEIDSRQTLERELRALKGLDDDYPKHIITMEKYLADEVDGIRIMTFLEWVNSST